ncbi:SDR family NAD(P)-dependent oxidoreductase [Pseudokineococcus marinus]|uniref:SDR family oxidoreductase n=1 Tax=Pseudokineococcus marinus TaxID=351215 RepID=A0A849BGQ0_9ACTN|nr:SDR family NAD(P)-dependent oxidoreductase [Pseudokineococcus marinus]NNH22269.1 SDR family oxidoreductase [Pseudokineococcus marinus]
MAQYDVRDRSAVVTGGGSGIGRAVALGLARSGASVLVADLDERGARSVAAEITGAGGTARPFTVDVTDAARVAEMVAAAQEMAPLRVAVNNAGIGGPTATTADYPADAWRRVIDVNLVSVFTCLQAEIPVMAENGGGSIINMASVLGSVGFAGSSAYVAAKHAVVGLTKSAAWEHADQGVRVNAVGPAFIATPLVEASLDERSRTALGAAHAVGRLGTPEEVAGLVAFLASDDAAFITGSYHLVDGGYSAR